MSNAERLMQAGAQMVKLEGGGWTAPTVRFLVERGVPVCAHLGLTPQTVHALGGWRVQGRDEAGAATLKRHAAELAEAGASMMVLELMPTRVSRELAASVPIPMIGIGAGSGLAGQVLVLHDMLGITPEPRPRFVRNFMQGATSIADALARYVADVKAGTYPDDAIHGFV
jgi:3-methyl-2-oxobutanoate hydroxymethyltransferase